VLAGPVDRHVELDFSGRPAGERGFELTIERQGHLFVESPRQDRQTGSISEGQCCLGRPLMVGVTCDAAFVEDEQQVGTNPVGDLADLGGKHVESLVGESEVRVLEQLDVTDAQLDRSLPDLGAADAAERFQVLSERGRLTSCEAQDRREGALVGEGTECGAEPEALVVRMRTDDENRCRRRQM
jgi:hypothetical protein